jgi:hypothetical protein
MSQRRGELLKLSSVQKASYFKNLHQTVRSDVPDSSTISVQMQHLLTYFAAQVLIPTAGTKWRDQL